jgi:3-hydroxyacyl-CoA dehydrogenase
MREIYRYLDNSPAPQDILRKKIEKGEVGRRSGKGFFEYEVTGALTSLEAERDRKLIQLLKVLYPED